MEIPSSPVKKIKTPTVPTPLNDKTSISCTNVPEGLFDPTAAKKHFSKFGKVQRIRLFPKKQMCIIEYDQVSAMEKALLNAGAFDGFMFDVTRTKTRLRKRSKKEDDPDWVPDADVEQELSALSETPVYRLSRQKPMDLETEVFQPKPSPRAVKHSPIRKRLPARDSIQPTSGIETPVAVAITQTSMSTLEAALEINQLRLKVSITPDEQWRTLDARDRILRAWGGAGSRVKVGGATIGTCPDMCPEKELLHRQAEHQVMTLETVLESDGALEPWRAVKQYSRSSADQEMPMCYELRPARVLMNTCAYLLHEIADTTRPVTLADWFHFMWDRFRGIRKDITQQALCCAESIQLVEICARFHAHCAARLADLENTQFDQKLNTDNLTKCLQTLKHMYADVGPEQKPREAEFRGYIALLNLGDSNFWWEIKQLPSEIQKSEDIQFAIKIFNALDNNNYIRFFRLIRDKATYLQACILLRYFNDVRARALARIVKAYAPRGGSRYPAEELMNSLAFESIESMKSFINHYGLRISKTDDSDVGVILDRNQFIEDSDPYPVARSIHLIECKRKDTVGKVIGGGHLPDYTFDKYNLYSSFRKDGKLKDSALLAEDLGYNTINDTNKDVSSLKTELLKLMQGNKIITNTQKVQETPTPPKGLFTKSDVKASQGKSRNPFVSGTDDANKLFSFKPAIPVASVDVIKNSPDKVERSLFSFSKPHDSPEQDTSKIFKINNSVSVSQNIFNAGVKSNENQEPTASLFKFNTPEVKSSSLFSQKPEESRNSIFKKPDDTSSSIFGNKQEDTNKNIFRNISNPSLFLKKDESSISEKRNVFGANSPFSKPTQHDVPNKQPTASIFGQIKTQENESKAQSSIFNPKTNLASSLFSKVNENNKVFTPNGGLPQSTSPGSFFKNALAPTQNGSDTSKSYSIFPSKNKGSSVADNIFNSVNVPSHDVYEFNQKDQEDEVQIRKIQEERERVEQENMRLEEIKKLEMQRLHEEKLKEERKREEERKQKEEKAKEEERRKLEEKRRKEEDLKQEELRKKLEEERKAEIKRKAEEEEKKFRERVEKESDQLIVELCDEITDENVKILIKEEMDKLNNLIEYAETTTEELLMELCNQVCESEVKAEKFLNSKIMKKWFEVWKLKVVRNIKRRNLLENTPVWLPHNTALEEASSLKRSVEMAALTNMNAIHRGYRFKGDIKQICYPKPYNVMEIIKSPLLKRMKQISYPYDKCFFWKTTIVSPGVMKWIHRKVELEPWLISVFSDGEKHQSDTLIYVGKQSWINLIDFAISISLIKDKNEKTNNEALEGSNGLLFYSIENDINFIDIIKSTLSHKYPYQIIPVAVVLPQNADDSQLANLDQFLAECVKCNTISTYRIFFVEKTNVHESLNKVTKSALKWLAKKYPTIPPLEIDNLKSLCQRYLANEIWFKLRSERDNRIITIAKDIRKLIQCYNEALDRLTKVITNEDLFNYPSFPLEFTDYLYHASPYPKPFEFISSIVKNSDNLSAIKSIMSQLKLPSSITDFQPKSVASMQDQIRTYCNEIGWFENPEEVVCKVVAVLPNELSDSTLPCENFDKCYEQYDLIDFLNIIVYEKISSIRNFDNVFAIYEKSSLEEYRSLDWLFSIDVIAKTKHKALEYEDDIDLFIKAKRRKIASESMEYLMLEEKDHTIVEENIKAANETILKYANCGDAVEQLEKQIELERIKSMELEMLLQSALSGV